MGSSGMVGRSAPLAELRALLGEAADGRGRSALLLGEPGMGKSTLLEAFTAAYEPAGGPLVAWGWCTPDAPPYWPWRAVLDAIGPDHPLRSTPGAGPEAARYALAAAVRDLLASGSRRRPIVVVLEDLHWADLPSLALLRMLVDALRTSRVLLLATARDDPGEAAPEVAAGLRDLPTAMLRIPLAGLAEAAVAELLAATDGSVPDPDLVRQVHRRTGGNPFFVREVARLRVAQGGRGAAGVPPGVREVLSRRLARLSQPCAELMAVAACAATGEEIDLDLVCRLGELTAAAALERLDEAVRAGLLRAEPPGRLQFGHVLVREVAQEVLPRPRRAQVHAEAAQWLEVAAAADPAGGADLAGLIAAHWDQALDAPSAAKAGRWALVAARAATSRLGFEPAVRWYERALSTATDGRLEILVELGEAQRLAGAPEAARRTLLAAVAAAREARRPELLARAVLGLGGGVAGFEVRVVDEAAAALLREALAALPADDSALRAAVAARLSLALTPTGSPAERASLAADAAAMARRVSGACEDQRCTCCTVPGSAECARVEAAALAAYCDAISGPEHVWDRLGAAGRILALSLATQDPVLELLARRLLVVAHMERGDLLAADTQIEEYDRSAVALGVPLFGWLPPLWRGARALAGGDVAGALRAADQAEAIGSAAGSENAVQMVLSLRLAANVAQGTAGSAKIPSVSQLVQGVPSYMVDASLVGMHTATGDLESASAAVTRIRQRGVERMRRDSEYLPQLWWLAEAAIALDHRELAEEVTAAMTPHRSLWAVEGIGAAVYGVVAHQLGRLAAARGDTAGGRALLVEAHRAHLAAGARGLAAASAAALTALGTHSPSPPAGGDRVEGELRREGRLWHLSFRGASATVPDAKGLRDLAVLLGRPDREVHVLDLVDPTGTARAVATDTGPVIDRAAATAYRDRLAELASDLAGAEADADLGRAQRLRDEQEFLTAELAGAHGLHGRSRVTGDAAERARKAVGMRLAAAVRAVSMVHPALGRHLRASVSTGRFCVYHPELPIRWQITP